MEGFILLLLIVVWAVAAWGTAEVAASKGHTGGEWIALGLFTGAFGLLIAVGIHPTREFEAKRADEVEMLRALAREAAGGSAVGLSTIPEEGLLARKMPEATEVPFARLAGGRRAYVLKKRGDWAYIRLDDGQQAWVDGSRLLRP